MARKEDITWIQPWIDLFKIYFVPKFINVYWHYKSRHT
jgi:hypothetical protein